MNGGDRGIMRELAGRVAEIAALSVQREKIGMWRRLHALDPVRPMVVIINGCWGEVLGESCLECVDPFMRDQELQLRRQLWAWEHLRDDFVVDGVIKSPLAIRDSGWGIRPNVVRTADGRGAAHFEPVIRSRSDLARMTMPEVRLDHDASNTTFDRLSELYDGVLPVRRLGISFFNFAIMDEYIQLRGVENTMMDLASDPEWVHEAMSFMLRGYLHRLEQLEALNVLSLNNGNCYPRAEDRWGVGPGGPGFTDLLPAAGYDEEHVRPMDMWGHATTQIFVQVSPEMHDEFALRYEEPWLARFGLSHYGCCEPLHHKLHLVKRIQNLRKVSISPWADVAVSADALGNHYVFSYKPNPSIFAEPRFDLEGARKGLRRVLEITRGCVLEIVMKDLETCRRDPERMEAWVRMAMEEVERV